MADGSDRGLRAPVKRVVVLANASGCGKTTVARDLARTLDAAFVELDGLNHGPGWTEATADELRAKLEPLLDGEYWVVDGSYSRKLGTFVLDAADTVVWLDLPVRVWLPRLVKRTARRVARSEELWNGNRETLRNAVAGRESLFVWAFRSHLRRRRTYPVELAGRNVVRLRSPGDVERFLDRTRRASA